MDTIESKLSPQPEAPAPAPAPAEPEPEQVPAWVKKVFTAPTGPGQVEQYKGGPLDFGGQPWSWRMARGLTGLFRAFDIPDLLNLAVIDIGRAVLELFLSRRPPAGQQQPTMPGVEHRAA